MSNLRYVVTANSDDGLYKIENDEWVALERRYRPKIVDPRTAFSIFPLETPKIDQKEHKMDRFKRFLGKFALYFGAMVVVLFGIYGVFNGVALLGRIFGPEIATIGVLLAFGSVFAALIAWLNSETPD